MTHSATTMEQAGNSDLVATLLKKSLGSCAENLREFSRVKLGEKAPETIIYVPANMYIGSEEVVRAHEALMGLWRGDRSAEGRKHRKYVNFGVPINLEGVDLAVALTSRMNRIIFSPLNVCYMDCSRLRYEKMEERLLSSLGSGNTRLVVDAPLENYDLFVSRVPMEYAHAVSRIPSGIGKMSRSDLRALIEQ